MLRRVSLECPNKRFWVGSIRDLSRKSLSFSQSSTIGSPNLCYYIGRLHRESQVWSQAEKGNQGQSQEGQRYCQGQGCCFRWQEEVSTLISKGGTRNVSVSYRLFTAGSSTIVREVGRLRLLQSFGSALISAKIYNTHITSHYIYHTNINLKSFNISIIINRVFLIKLIHFKFLIESNSFESSLNTQG